MEHFSWASPHENVVQIFEILDVAKCRPQIAEVADLQSSPIAIYAMELAMFSQRKFVLLHGGVVPLPMVRHLLQGTLGGVAHLHRNAFIHRDLKPDNILMCLEATTGRLVPKIADLGSVQTADNARTRGVCTPHYRAPELFREVVKASLDAAGRASSDAAAKMPTKYGGEVDVWSCGVIAAELLLGRHPWLFTSEDWPTVFAAIAAKLGRPGGAKVPLMVGVSAQEMVAGGMWKDDAAARRPLKDIPAQARELVTKMCRWRHATRIPLINKAFHFSVLYPIRCHCSGLDPTIFHFSEDPDEIWHTAVLPGSRG